MPKLTGGATTAEHKIATREAMLDAFHSRTSRAGLAKREAADVGPGGPASRGQRCTTTSPTNPRCCSPGPHARWTRFLLLAERELADRENPVDRLEILVKLTLVEFSLQRFTGIALVELLSAQDRESFLEHIVPLSVLVEQLVQEGVDAGVFVDSDAAASRATHPRLRGKPTPDAHGRRPSGRRRSDHRPVHHARVGRCVADLPSRPNPPIALLTIGRIADMHFDLPPIDQQAERLIELGVHEMAGLLCRRCQGGRNTGTVMSTTHRARKTGSGFSF